VLRRLAICFAFATCCFLNTWVEFAEGENVYFARYDPFRVVALPVLAWQIFIVLGMWGSWEFIRRCGRSKANGIDAVFLSACVVPLGITAVAVVRLLPFDVARVVRSRLFWPVILVLAAAPLRFVMLRPAAASRWMRSILLYAVPVLVWIFIQGARATLLRYPRGAYADGPFAVSYPRMPRLRVVWIVFDELSQSVAFDSRPTDLKLPNFDRLKNESFYTTGAHAPAGFTESSLPALVLGERITAATPQGPSSLLLATESQPNARPWNSIPNVFDAARARNLNTAVVGWYHPYGRLLNRSLTQSYWTAGWLSSGVEEPSESQTLIAGMWFRARMQLITLPLLGRVPGMSPWIYRREEQIQRFSYLLDRARQVVADPLVGLALIHLPAPHPPAIYSRVRQTLTSESGHSYLDGVALADRTLGILRNAVRRAGLEDRTAILVSSDHGWRPYLWRPTAEWTDEDETVSHRDTSGIPFLLKLPAQTAARRYDRPFNTVVTKQIILSILDGRVQQPDSIADLIEVAASSFPVSGR